MAVRVVAFQKPIKIGTNERRWLGFGVTETGIEMFTRPRATGLRTGLVWSSTGWNSSAAEPSTPNGGFHVRTTLAAVKPN